MVCHRCGKQVQREDRFCTGCGVRLHQNTEPDEPVEADASADEPVEPDQPDEPVEPVQPDGPVETEEPVDWRPDPVAIADEPTELVPTMRRPAQPSTAAAPSPTSPIPETQPTPTVAPTPAVADAVTASSDTALDDRAASIDTVGGDEWSADDPVWATTGTVPAQPAGADTEVAAPAADPSQPDGSMDATAGFTADMPVTEPITEVWTEPVEASPEPETITPFDFVEHEVTAEVAPAVLPPATAEMPAVVVPAQPAHRFRLSAVTMIAVLTGLVMLASLFATMIAVTSDQRLEPSEQTPFGFRTGTWIADDLADNLSIAGLAAIILMVVGGVASAFHWRWGAGLAGGAGLAVAGLAGLTIGLAQIPIDAAHEFVAIPTDQQFTLTITRDLGYWLMVAAAALGVVLFFAAINDASGDRRSGLNPWIAAVGALAAVVAAAGPLIPENQAVISDNWYLIEGPGEAPAMLLVGRLVQLGLFLMAGVVGFLTVRRWGLGLAIGASVPIIWLAASTLFELTDKPVGPGFRNPGATDMHIHGVTIIGVSAVAAMSLLAVIAAYDQAVRERR